MKLARCDLDGASWWGAVEQEEIALLTPSCEIPISSWRAGALEKAVVHPSRVMSLQEVVLLSPVRDPSKVICVGLNYREHAVESGMEIPEQPIIFAKFPSAIIGPGRPIVLPEDSQEVDWEVELAIVIGNTARNVSESNALDYIAGYTVANDISARDLQVADGQFTRAKSFETFCPVGPWITTIDELGAADNLAIGLSVNGQTFQDSNTSDLVFGLAEIVAFCSRVATLNPGDLILTGTPQGTGYGLSPQRYLSPGDEITAWVEGIGELSNPVEGP